MRKTNILHAELKKRLVILYGSQTGVSEKFAYSLYNSAKARNFETLISKMDDFNYKNDLQKEKNILFLLSTFYNGEFPDNAKYFWEYLNNTKLPSDYLLNTNYSVFGLGNSSFKATFTRSSKLLDAKLNSLGAKRIIATGFGDEYDVNGHESGFRPWTKRLW